VIDLTGDDSFVMNAWWGLSQVEAVVKAMRLWG
jgi:hypothetical protein